MTFLAPEYLAALGLAVPILALYLLKLRRPEVKVSSLYLWQQVIQDQEANAPWQRLRRNLLLILQLIILTLLSLALARPTLPTTTLASGSLVILLDASASMQAQDVKPDRFTAAKQTAEQLIQDLEPNAQITLIAVYDQPEILAASERDRTKLLQALDTIEPSNTNADWETAGALATGAVQSLGQETTTVFITDGGAGKINLPPIPGEVRYYSIGSSGENIGVSHLAVEIVDQSAHLFSQISNYGYSETTVLASVYRGTELIHAREIPLQGGEKYPLFLDNLPISPSVYEVHVEPALGEETTPNYLLQDDRSAFPLRGDFPRSGILITDGNFFLEQILGAFKGITFSRALGEAEILDNFNQRQADIIVLDGLIPNSLPGVNLLIINPPRNNLFQVEGDFSLQNLDTQVTNHALADDLMWDEVHIRRSKEIELPYWGETMVKAGARPLVFVGEQGGRRIAVIGFDLFESDLPLSTDFPILMAGLIDYLSPGDPLGLPTTVPPGHTLTALTKPQFENTTLITPSQQEIEIPAAAATSEQLTFKDIGTYSIISTVGQIQYEAFIAVNLQDPAEVTILPTRELHIGNTTASPSAITETGSREVWPILALMAFLVLLIEWWVSRHSQLGITNDRANSLVQIIRSKAASFRSQIR